MKTIEDKALKCKDLMIGDWVQDCTKFPMQVEVVGEDYLYANFEGNEGDVWEFDDKIEPPVPIAISKEILEKNGFEWVESANGDDFVFAMLWLKEEKTYIEWKNSSKTLAIWLDYEADNDGVYSDIVFPVKYVHEMQQVLRLAGLEDVANNFKV